ncbi:hypothetical protein AAG906_001285 [Vitis piasezkii]
MQRSRKRKQEESSSCSKESATKSARNDVVVDPYPSHPRPTPVECRAVRDDLLALHGFPQRFEKYRKLRLPPLPHTSSPGLDGGGGTPVKLDQSDGDDVNGSSQKESVLDGLVSIILSQNTTDVNSQRAFASLKSAFPTWQDVLAADSKSIENAIRCGGLAVTKASCIKKMLSCLLERKGKLCLEYLRDLTVDEIKTELSHFKGIGPKTVIQIGKAIGWVPAVADRKKAYLHLNRRIPDELKFDLNCLLFTHGKLCHECTQKGANQKRKESHESSCPLLTYCGDAFKSSSPN